MKTAILVVMAVLIIVSQLVALGLHSNKLKAYRNPLWWIAPAGVTILASVFLGHMLSWLLAD